MSFDELVEGLLTKSEDSSSAAVAASSSSAPAVGLRCAKCGRPVLDGESVSEAWQGFDQVWVHHPSCPEGAMTWEQLLGEKSVWSVDPLVLLDGHKDREHTAFALPPVVGARTGLFILSLSMLTVHSAVEGLVTGGGLAWTRVHKSSKPAVGAASDPVHFEAWEARGKLEVTTRLIVTFDRAVYKLAWQLAEVEL